MDTVMICLTGTFVILMGVIAVQTVQKKSTPCFVRTASAYKTIQSQISAISKQKLRMEFVTIWQTLKSVPMMGVSKVQVL
jgi:tRNA A37 threonylcarbamoyladenosine dehydratase